MVKKRPDWSYRNGLPDPSTANVGGTGGIGLRHSSLKANAMETRLVRGGVFIGVDRTKGELDPLYAAASSAKKMYDWAIDPDLGAMDLSCVRLVSDAPLSVADPDAEADARRPVVTPQQVRAAVSDVVEKQGVDQLILYFSGHGMVINGFDTWLLSEAPDDADAAISVSRCIRFARAGITPHVVIISDACRTAATDLYTQDISGASLFRNPPDRIEKMRVDVFYATPLGVSAVEVNRTVPEDIYTDVLHGALTGAVPEILSPGKTTDDTWRYVWSAKLGKYLEIAVAKRLIALQIVDEDRTPKCDVNSGDDNLHWLVRLRPPPPSGAVVIPDEPRWDESVPLEDSITVAQVAEGLVQAIADPAASFKGQLERAGRAPAPGASRFVESVQDLAQPFTRRLQLPEAAITVQGAAFTRATSSRGSRYLYADDSRQSISLEPLLGMRPENVVAEFDNGTVALLPVLPGYVTDITVHGREIIAVSFESRQGQPDKLDAIRELRAVVSASVQRGRFGLADNGLEIARSLQALKGEDPALAVYAAYSYYEIQANEQIYRMNAALRDQLSGSTLFDVGLLSGYLSQDASDFVEIRQWARDRTVVPYVPLLAQGWELLDGAAIDDRSWSERVRSKLIPSLWTVFDISAASDLVEMMGVPG